MGGQQPSDLLYGEIACDKDGTLYVGNSSNVPTYMLNSDIYNQVGNPNLLDNSDFTNPVNQRNKTEFDINGYCIDRWQIFESTLMLIQELLNLILLLVSSALNLDK